MSPDTIDAMLEAGLTREQMAALMKHEIAKEEEAKAKKRAAAAERQRRSRASRNVTVTERDCARQGVTPPSLNDPLPNLETVEVNLNPPPYSPPALENADDMGFSELWAVYPGRDGGNSRKNAEQRFRKAVKSGTAPEDIIEGARRYAAHCDATGKTGTEFVKTAEAWLNGRFWESNYSISAPRGSPPRQARRNTALEGLDELERRFTTNAQPHLRIAG